MEKLPSKPLYEISRGRAVNSNTDCNCRKHVILGMGIYPSYLQMIISKRRNRVDLKKLETLSVLAVLKISCTKQDVWK